MPGKSKQSVTEQVTVIIGEREIVLQPLVGTRAMIVVPKLLKFISRLLFGAAQGNINLSALVTEDGLDLGALRAENVLAVYFIMQEFEKNWDLVTKEIAPTLLGVPAAFLEENGTPFEHLEAWFRAATYHAPSIFGPKVWTALKKLSAAPEAEAEAPGQTTSSG